MFLLGASKNYSNNGWMATLCATLSLSATLGILTPFVCAAIVLVEFSSLSGLPLDQLAQQTFLLAVAGSVVVLGPGAYSLDSRWFGRRVIKSGHSD